MSTNVAIMLIAAARLMNSFSYVRGYDLFSMEVQKVAWVLGGKSGVVSDLNLVPAGDVMGHRM